MANPLIWTDPTMETGPADTAVEEVVKRIQGGPRRFCK